MQVYLGKNKYPTIDDSYEKWEEFFKANHNTYIRYNGSKYGVYLEGKKISEVIRGVAHTIKKNYGNWQSTTKNGLLYYDLPLNLQRKH